MFKYKLMIGLGAFGFCLGLIMFMDQYVAGARTGKELLTISGTISAVFGGPVFAYIVLRELIYAFFDIDPNRKNQTQSQSGTGDNASGNISDGGSFGGGGGCGGGGDC